MGVLSVGSENDIFSPTLFMKATIMSGGESGEKREAITSVSERQHNLSIRKADAPEMPWFTEGQFMKAVQSGQAWLGC